MITFGDLLLGHRRGRHFLQPAVAIIFRARQQQVAISARRPAADWMQTRRRNKWLLLPDRSLNLPRSAATGRGGRVRVRVRRKFKAAVA